MRATATIFNPEEIQRLSVYQDLRIPKKNKTIPERIIDTINAELLLKNK